MKHAVQCAVVLSLAGLLNGCGAFGVPSDQPASSDVPEMNTLLGVTDTDDLPNYVPEWLPPERQLVYYATRITLEGLGLS